MPRQFLDPFLWLRNAPIRVPASSGPLPPGAWTGLRMAQMALRRPISSPAFNRATIGLRTPQRKIPATLRQQPTIHVPRRQFRFSSRQRSSKQQAAPEKEPQSLGARLRKLSREYGWVALGVYLGLSVLDFPFCFLLVKVVGTEKIGQLEHFVVSNVAKAIPDTVKVRWAEYKKSIKSSDQDSVDQAVGDSVEMVGWGVEEAQEANREGASLATQLALAYAIHKSFIFLRVPLTAAVTPKVVKVLRSWGWQIGKRKGKKVKP